MDQNALPHLYRSLTDSWAPSTVPYLLPFSRNPHSSSNGALSQSRACAAAAVLHPSPLRSPPPRSVSVPPVRRRRGAPSLACAAAAALRRGPAPTRPRPCGTAVAHYPGHAHGPPPSELASMPSVDRHKSRHPVQGLVELAASRRSPDVDWRWTQRRSARALQCRRSMVKVRKGDVLEGGADGRGGGGRGGRREVARPPARDEVELHGACVEGGGRGDG
uniref:Uncharacterized protein n=1 Tax=Setaria viridis TaxID=4556 RepID=A0A4U6TBZ9_SETVI|nr:hypothetical protein SEVIR_9G531500v2 [Setaria viridis]